MLLLISNPLIYALKKRGFRKNGRINILFVIATLNIGGTEVQLKNLLKYLNKNKYNPLLCILAETGPLEKEIRQLNIPIFFLGKKSKFNLRIIFDIAKIIKKNEVNIVHTSLFASNFWGRLGALLGGVKIIIASERSAYRTPNFVFFDKILAYFTNKIICNSRAVQNYQIKKKGINPAKLEIIYNGLDLEKFNENLLRAKQERLNYRRQLKIQNDEFVIGNVCRITPEKDLLTWLKTAKILLDKTKRLKFIIVGDAVSAIGEETGYKKQIVDLINESGIENNVVMTGFSDDVTRELAVMDLFYQSSVIEGFPNSVMEAMAAGLPVVATPAGGTEEMIIDNENGIIVPMKKTEETAKIIIGLMNDVEKMRIIGEKARLTIKNNFSGESLARNTEKLYDQLLSR